MDTKTENNMFTIKNIDYLVISTGYTYSLISDTDKIEKECKYAEYNTKILFIYDKESKEKLIMVTEEKNNDILELVKMCQNIEGSICFKCSELQEAIEICEILKDIEYCNNFSLLNLSQMDIVELENGNKTCIMHINSCDRKYLA